MIVCCYCKITMRCDKNSVGADFGNGHVYPGDRFRCPRCEALVLVCNRVSHFDPEHKYQDEYLTMAKLEDKAAS